MGSHHQHNNFPGFDVNGFALEQKSEIWNLVVIFYPELSFETHIQNITKFCFFHFRNIAKLRSCLSLPDAKRFIQALVSSWIDYCNALFAGLPAKALLHVQIIQSAAARVLTNSRKYDRIIPVLTSLHWLLVQFGADFKILLLTYKGLHSLAPLYLTELLSQYIPGCTLC